MSKRNFLLAVTHEVKMLKKHTTLEERSKLNFENFDPTTKMGCVYGQMTGSCDTFRARELMGLCCRKELNVSNAQLEYSTFDEVKPLLTGITKSYRGTTWDSGVWHRRSYDYLSALEAYIFIRDTNRSHVLEYLMDKTNTIKLNLVD